jgi:sec-independent protein translocase protein TatA
MTYPLIAGLGPQELVLIVLVILLLFGAKKLPELARGSGRALRIFKAETKGLMDDDDDDDRDRGADPTKGDNAQRSPEQRELQARPPTLDAETERQAAERRAADRRDDPA